MKDLEKDKSNIYSQALHLAVPMMIQSGITNAVGLVDNLMVGSLGTERMTAVSIVGQLFFVFSLAVFGGLSGPGIYGAQYYGQKNDEGIKNAFRLKWWISMFIVFAGIIIFFLFGNNLISLYLQGESEGIDAALTLQSAHDYLMIMLIGLVPFGITQIYAGSLRETGESIKPMVAGLSSVVTDVLFNYLLIFGNFGFPQLGVKGAAIATVISRFVECATIIIWTHLDIDRHYYFKAVYKRMIVPFSLASVVIVKSLPVFLNEFFWAGGMAAITQSLSTRGLAIVAGSNISNALCNLLNVVFIAMGNAVGILTGQKLGASDFEGAKKDSFKLMKFSASICVGLSLILLAFSKYFPMLYETTDDVRFYGTFFIRITAIFFPVQGFLNALYFTIRSGGKTIVTFLFDSIYTWILPVPVSFLLCKFTGLSIFSIFVIVQMADVIKIIIGWIMFKKEIWITNLVTA